MASTSNQPMDKLKDASRGVVKSLGEKAMSTVTDRVGGLTDKLEDIADGGPIGKAVAKGGEAAAEGKSPVGGALKGALSGVKDKITGGGGGGNKSPKATKAMNIIEEIDVGVPITVAYNQWTQYDEFPSFMKKVENADEMDDEDTKISWKAQVFWSHRTWEATVLDQYPDERIVWKSTGEKGHVDGAVTFHEITPNLTRILLVLEYYPQGFMERTGNLWRAQGRRARLELKHFRRHVMTRTILNPDEVEGWRGIIEDGEVVKTHDEVLEEEQQEQEEPEEQEEPDGDYEDEYEGEEGEESEESEEPEDEYEGEEEEEPEEGEEPEEPENISPRRRRAS
ncbi:MAG TPA: SRPBCC family protein [Nocardioidaceae bacterium]|nr:SRPBCC family protein [Nocardioidaceae bacterium]